MRFVSRKQTAKSNFLMTHAKKVIIENGDWRMMILGGLKSVIISHHTKFVCFSWALLEMQVCILDSVVKTRRYRADTIVELAANVTLQAICRDYHGN